MTKKKSPVVAETKPVVEPAKVAKPTTQPVAAKPVAEPVRATKPGVEPPKAATTVASAVQTKPAAEPVKFVKPAPTVAPAAPAPAAKPVVPAAASTPKPAAPAFPAIVIEVNADVGFGNRVFVRGEGSGLTWDKGEPADCVASDLWRFEIKEARQPVTFKVLVNDSVWSAGENCSVEPGAKVTIAPSF